jgi:hypothetical protein
VQVSWAASGASGRTVEPGQTVTVIGDRNTFRMHQDFGLWAEWQVTQRLVDGAKKEGWRVRRESTHPQRRRHVRPVLLQHLRRRSSSGRRRTPPQSSTSSRIGSPRARNARAPYRTPTSKSSGVYPRAPSPRPRAGLAIERTARAPAGGVSGGTRAADRSAEGRPAPPPPLARRTGGYGCLPPEWKRWDTLLAAALGGGYRLRRPPGS